MKMRFALATLAVIAVVFCGVCGAEEAVAGAQPAASAAPAQPATPPAAPAAATEEKVAVTTVVGKVSVKTEMVEGKEVKTAQIAVAEAKAEDGAPVATLKFKTLAVTGDKAADVVKLDGKTVEAKGVVTEMKSIEVKSVAEKKPATMEAKPEVKEEAAPSADKE